MGYSSWGYKESDATHHTQTHRVVCVSSIYSLFSLVENSTE